MEINTIYLGDCLELIKSIPDNSIDMILTDPPYFEVKGDFDFNYEGFTEYLQFVEKCAIAIKRVLKDNGSIIWFGDAKKIAYTQIIFDKYYTLLNCGVWEKLDSQAKRCDYSQMRVLTPVTERFLFYEHSASNGMAKTGLQEIYSNKDCFQSIKKYMRDERDKLMSAKGYTTISQFNDYINNLTQKSSVASRHYFADSQYTFPTAEMYGRMQTSGYWQREYEALREEYEALRRPFRNENLQLSDVIRNQQDSHTTKNYKHPTQKPISLIRKLIEVCTKENALVLDLFSGSGTIAEACAISNRNFIAFELDSTFFEMSKNRLDLAMRTKTAKLF